MLRGHLADITYVALRIKDIESHIETASESYRYQESVQILLGIRGIGLITAMQLICEFGDFRRSEKPTALMVYMGLVPSLRSSGNTIRSGAITKTDNVHA